MAVSHQPPGMPSTPTGEYAPVRFDAMVEMLDMIDCSPDVPDDVEVEVEVTVVARLCNVLGTSEASSDSADCTVEPPELAALCATAAFWVASPAGSWWAAVS
ncbi:hypothetical protein C1Y40_05031 [Mycobacterium talmoniae]|uniref:Uncharacterized protein n=1 Tax=Mycobacterium talmoniae TaxID=1858794 RepID=A0A2S8BDU2_9MYCO|nr:hypothetical protein C1Y40_05031 [Mycobacterium talmoniae]